MVRYETLMLVRSESTAEERAFLEKSISGLVAQHNGVVNAFDQWGKLRLAYQVQKEKYGQYILVRFELPGDVITKLQKDLSMFFKIKAGEFVMRHVVVRIPEDAPATYAHPEPVDSAKALAEAGSFVRENRPRGGFRGERGDRPERSERPFQVIGGSGKRFSHDHSSDDVMSSVTDEMDS